MQNSARGVICLQEPRLSQGHGKFQVREYLHKVGQVDKLCPVRKIPEETVSSTTDNEEERTGYQDWLHPGGDV